MNGPSPIPPRGRALSDAEKAGLVDDLEEIIESSHLFRTLDAPGRRDLIEMGYVIEFDPGETLMQQGEDGPNMLLLMSGKVSVEASSGRGSIKLAVLGRGACLGEVAVLTGAARTANVTALEAVKAVAFAKDRIHRIIEGYPRIGELLEAMVEGRARDTVEKIIGSG